MKLFYIYIKIMLNIKKTKTNGKNLSQIFTIEYFELNLSVYCIKLQREKIIFKYF